MTSPRLEGISRAPAEPTAKSPLPAPVPAHPPAGSLMTVARQHPSDALRMTAGLTSPMRPSYLFHVRGARIEEFPGKEHDLMLDAGLEQPFEAMERWLDGQEGA